MISTIENHSQGVSGETIFTKPMLKRFKRAYNKAVKDSDGDMQATFKFEGNEFVIGYAKYLIYFLEPKLK